MLGGAPFYLSPESRKESHSFEIGGCFSEVIALVFGSVFVLLSNLFKSNSVKALEYRADNGKSQRSQDKLKITLFSYMENFRNKVKHFKFRAASLLELNFN